VSTWARWRAWGPCRAHQAGRRPRQARRGRQEAPPHPRVLLALGGLHNEGFQRSVCACPPQPVAYSGRHPPCDSCRREEGAQAHPRRSGRGEEESRIRRPWGETPQEAPCGKASSKARLRARRRVPPFKGLGKPAPDRGHSPKEKSGIEAGEGVASPGAENHQSRLADSVGCQVARHEPRGVTAGARLTFPERGLSAGIVRPEAASGSEEAGGLAGRARPLGSPDVHRRR